MAKTEKELQELKGKVEELNKELEALTDEELDQVAGGITRRRKAGRKKAGRNKATIKVPIIDKFL